MIYVGNAFSLQMVASQHLRAIRIAPLGMRPVLDGLVWESCVGHIDTAALLGVPFRRVSVTLVPGDILFVAQVVGGRLPEGSTTLPPGARIEWAQVQVAT